MNYKVSTVYILSEKNEWIPRVATIPPNGGRKEKQTKKKEQQQKPTNFKKPNQTKPKAIQEKKTTELLKQSAHMSDKIQQFLMWLSQTALCSLIFIQPTHNVNASQVCSSSKIVYTWDAILHYFYYPGDGIKYNWNQKCRLLVTGVRDTINTNSTLRMLHQ